MVVAFAMVSAVVPSLLILVYVHLRDTFREPPRLVWSTFALGALAIVPDVLVALPVVAALGAVGIRSVLVLALFRALVPAAMLEEALKLLVLSRWAGRKSAFDEPLDGIVYGVAASLGFATLENVLYASEGGVELALGRAWTAVPMHAGCGVLMGHYYARSRFEIAGRRRLFALAYLVPVFLHALYDLPMIAVTILSRRADRPPAVVALTLFCSGVVVLGATVVWAGVVARRARREQVARGAAPPPPLVPDVAGPARPPSRVVTVVKGIVALIAGGLVASVGGMVTLGVILLVVRGAEGHGVAELLGGGAGLGVLPLALGLALFVYAIRTLNRARLPS